MPSMMKVTTCTIACSEVQSNQGSTSTMRATYTSRSHSWAQSQTHQRWKKSKMMFDHVDDLTLLDSGGRIHLVEDPQAWNMLRVAVSVVPISIVKSKKIKNQWLLQGLKNTF